MSGGVFFLRRTNVSADVRIRVCLTMSCSNSFITVDHDPQSSPSELAIWGSLPPFSHTCHPHFQLAYPPFSQEQVSKEASKHGRVEERSGDPVDLEDFLGSGMLKTDFFGISVAFLS